MVRVLLAEDHTIVREGLRALLAREADLEVVGEVADGASAVSEAQRLRPDVVVMDLAMPGLDGVEATRRIRRDCPGTQVLMLSMYGDEDHVRPAVRAGVRGFLLKGAGLADLIAAIRAVAAGEEFFRVPGGAAARAEGETDAEAVLTPRELQILRRVIAGRASADIAAELGIGIKTVEAHRSRMMQKLGVRNAAALVRRAVELGIAGD